MPVMFSYITVRLAAFPVIKVATTAAPKKSCLVYLLAKIVPETSQSTTVTLLRTSMMKAANLAVKASL